MALNRALWRFVTPGNNILLLCRAQSSANAAIGILFYETLFNFSAAMRFLLLFFNYCWPEFANTNVENTSMFMPRSLTCFDKWPVRVLWNRSDWKYGSARKIAIEILSFRQIKRHLCGTSVIFACFWHITITFGKFAGFEALFPAMSMNICWQAVVKSYYKTVDELIRKLPVSLCNTWDEISTLLNNLKRRWAFGFLNFSNNSTKIAR